MPSSTTPSAVGSGAAESAGEGEVEVEAMEAGGAGVLRRTAPRYIGRARHAPASRTPRYTMTMARSAVTLAGFLVLASATLHAQSQAPRRARQLGVAPGIFAPGANNAITDVAGVLVGQTTVDDGDSIHTGITAILPHAGNMFAARVPAAIVVGNGFGKLVGVTQVGELGEIETPILLTCTLCVWRAADAMVGWLLAQ